MSDFKDLSLLRFHHGPAPRIWGGTRLRQAVPARQHETRIGEDWLIADHPQHESVVCEGNFAGATLCQLLQSAPDFLLGRRPSLTPAGRFPLLLKLLDAAEPLSVQVHPDDAAALRLGEPDVGKTEMWHVIESAPGSELVCGLQEFVREDEVRRALESGTIEDLLVRFPAPAGTTVFVPAGTVHAIGAGAFLAEIQQNSDITYRLHDYGRTDASGIPRTLHLEKGLEVIHFGSPHTGQNLPLGHPIEGAGCTILGACRYFAGRRLDLNGTCDLLNRAASFHILLPLEGMGEVCANGATAVLEPFQAVLVAGGVDTFSLTGVARVLDYFVPDLANDILLPLRAAGHPDADIIRLGGSMGESDLLRVL